MDRELENRLLSVSVLTKLQFLDMNIHYPPDTILSGKRWKRIEEHITESSVEEYVHKVVSLRGSRRIAIVGRFGATKWNDTNLTVYSIKR